MAWRTPPLIEGVRGLFDGRTGGGEIGSTAHVAKLLGLPVLLVVDAAKAARAWPPPSWLLLRARSATSRSSASSSTTWPGARHAEIGRDAVESLTGVRSSAGWRATPICQEERYLGLVLRGRGRLPVGLVDRLTALVEEQLDLDRLLQLSHTPRVAPRAGAGLFPSESVPTRVRIAVAQDEAFSFYYQDSLDLLTAWGAELVPVSPLRDAALPIDVGGVYLGGGFPELFAIDLAVKPRCWRLRAAAQAACRSTPSAAA